MDEERRRLERALAEGDLHALDLLVLARARAGEFAELEAKLRELLRDTWFLSEPSRRECAARLLAGAVASGFRACVLWTGSSTTHLAAHASVVYTEIAIGWTDGLDQPWHLLNRELVWCPWSKTSSRDHPKRVYFETELVRSWLHSLGPRTLGAGSSPVKAWTAREESPRVQERWYSR